MRAGTKLRSYRSLLRPDHRWNPLPGVASASCPLYPPNAHSSRKFRSNHKLQEGSLERRFARGFLALFALARAKTGSQARVSRLERSSVANESTEDVGAPAAPIGADLPSDLGAPCRGPGHIRQVGPRETLAAPPRIRLQASLDLCGVVPYGLPTG